MYRRLPLFDNCRQPYHFVNACIALQTRRCSDGELAKNQLTFCNFEIFVVRSSAAATQYSTFHLYFCLPLWSSLVSSVASYVHARVILNFVLHTNNLCSPIVVQRPFNLNTTHAPNFPLIFYLVTAQAQAAFDPSFGLLLFPLLHT